MPVLYLVLLLDAGQAVKLGLDGIIVNLFKQQFRLGYHCSDRHEVVLAQTLPAERLYAEHGCQAGGAERHERLHGYAQVGAELQRAVQYGGGALHIRLGHFPRLRLLEILVAQTGYLHHILQRLAEVECIEVALQACTCLAHVSHQLAVDILKLRRCRHLTVEIFLGEHCGAVHEVAQHSHELIVVTCLEVGPGEVVVLRFRSVGRQHIAEHILLAGEVAQIFVEPYSPVARGRYLVALQVQEFIGRHIVGQLKSVAVGHQHGGEHYAVKHNVVLAYEVDNPGFGVLPIGLP